MSNSTHFAKTPEPPYYAVIFTSRRTEDDNGYGKMADRMETLATGRPGFLGIESARDAEGFGITISYWETTEAIAAWKADLSHVAAQDLGKQRWYEHYEVRVARVERAYGKPDE
jgi:heme-degrading monooxygenase HmoA